MAIKLVATVDAKALISAEAFDSANEAQNALVKAVTDALGKYGQASHVRVSLELGR